ncbi:MAG: threonine ammonia-lyase [Longimicrobiales bacterium]
MLRPSGGAMFDTTMLRSLGPISLEAIQEARRRIHGSAVRTPLIRFESERTSAQIWLKLENLQPVGSFKIRGAASAMLALPPETLARGVCTASAGNMAQGVAWMARQLGIPCTVVVPESAPRAKIDAVERLGARTVEIPFTAWWQTLVDRAYPGVDGHFIHPVADPDVMAGNGTIGLEIVDDLPDVDAILVPFGGGGLSCGIASALRALQPNARVLGCEPSTAAPLNASWSARRPVAIDRVASFVDGCGGRAILPEMWPLVSTLLAGAYAPTLDEIATAVRCLAERSKIVAEGAGAVALAAALGSNAPDGNIVCIVSGGCIDTDKLAVILGGGRA